MIQEEAGLWAGTGHKEGEEPGDLEVALEEEEEEVGHKAVHNNAIAM